MVSLEQVKLLETKVAKAIDFVKSLSEENAALRGKLDGYRRRIDELEVLVKAFKEDQGRIEAGIMSALERLNQFEDAVERGLSSGTPAAGFSEKSTAAVDVRPAAEDIPSRAEANLSQSPADSDEAILAELEAEEAAAREKAARSADAVPETLPETLSVAAAEPLGAEPPVSGAEEASHNEGAELDIF